MDNYDKKREIELINISIDETKKELFDYIKSALDLLPPNNEMDELEVDLFEFKLLNAIDKAKELKEIGQELIYAEYV